MDSLRIVIQFRQLVHDLQIRYNWFVYLLNPYIFFLISTIIAGILFTAFEGLFGALWKRLYLTTRIRIFNRSFIIKKEYEIFAIKDKLNEIISEMDYSGLLINELGENEFLIRKARYSQQNKTSTPVMSGVLIINPLRREANLTGILNLSSTIFYPSIVVLFLIPIFFFPPTEGISIYYYLILPFFYFTGFLTYRIQAKEFNRLIEMLSDTEPDKKQ